MAARRRATTIAAISATDIASPLSVLDCRSILATTMDGTSPPTPRALLAAVANVRADGIATIECDCTSYNGNDGRCQEKGRIGPTDECPFAKNREQQETDRKSSDVEIKRECRHPRHIASFS